MNLENLISKCCLGKVIGYHYCHTCGEKCESYDEASFKAGQEAGRQEIYTYFKDNGYMMPGFGGRISILKLKEWGIE